MLEKRRNDGSSFSFCTSFPLWLVNNTKMAIIHEVHWVSHACHSVLVAALVIGVNL